MVNIKEIYLQMQIISDVAGMARRFIWYDVTVSDTVNVGLSQTQVIV